MSARALPSPAQRSNPHQPEPLEREGVEAADGTTCQPTDEDAERDRSAKDHRAAYKRHRTESDNSVESLTASAIDAQMKFGAPTVTVAFGPLLETSHDVPVVAPSWNARDFADCAERLIRDPDLRRAQVNATLAAADRYSWDRTADEFTRMYRQLLSRSKR